MRFDIICIHLIELLLYIVCMFLFVMLHYCLLEEQKGAATTLFSLD